MIDELVKVCFCSTFLHNDNLAIGDMTQSLDPGALTLKIRRSSETHTATLKSGLNEGQRRDAI
jgi:hypothetical protein